MKAIAYTTFCSRVWQSFKLYCGTFDLPRTERAYGDFFQKALRRLRQRPELTPVDHAIFTADILCTFLWKFRRIRHFFLAPGVADFCASAVKEISADCALALPECAPLPGLEGRRTVPSGFALHFPAKERTRSLLCIPNFCCEVSQSMAAYYYAAVADGETIAVLQRDSELKTDDADALLMEKTVFGFSLYIAAFPETLHPGDPGDIHVASHYRGDLTAVSRSPIVDEEERAALSPHWRRGHFHLLTHPRFTQKRFQSVYVKGCFVRGSALEVDDDAPALQHA